MLYSVRVDAERDLPATLDAVAKLGYEGVELYGLHGQSAPAVRGLLDSCGLTACGRHARLEDVESQLPALAEELEALGTDRLVVSWIDPPQSGTELVAHADRLERAAAQAARLGVRLGFHNHDGELRRFDGRNLLDELLGREVLFLELDLGWAWWAGADPVALLEQAVGRCPLVHVKDFAVAGERSFCPVGDGSVDYGRIAPAAVRAGAEWLLVEQDETDGSALDDARRSLTALRLALEARPA